MIEFRLTESEFLLSTWSPHLHAERERCPLRFSRGSRLAAQRYKWIISPTVSHAVCWKRGFLDFPNISRLRHDSDSSSCQHIFIYKPLHKGERGFMFGKAKRRKNTLETQYHHHYHHQVWIKKISLQQRVEKSLADILQHLSFWSWDGAKEAHRRTQTSQHQKHSSRVSQSTTLRRLEVRSKNSTLIKAHSRLLQKVTTRNERWWSRGGSNSWKHTLRTSERFPKPFHPSFHRPPPPYSHSWMNEGRTREEGPYPFKSTTTTTLPPAAALAAGKRQRHPPKKCCQLAQQP